MKDGKSERFVIQSCELSANGDYWVIRSNSKDYVVLGMTEFWHVGVKAHLINAVHLPANACVADGQTTTLARR